MHKVLVVDNDVLILEFINDVLLKAGYQVMTAKNGLSALDILKTFTPQSIIVDLVMPDIDGKRLCRIIRRTDRLKDSYLIVLSAIVAEAQTEIAELGANLFIAKGPFSEMGQHLVEALNYSDRERSQLTSGKRVGVKGVCSRTITRELLSTNRHLEAMLEGMAEGILEINPEGKVIYANSAACSFLNMEVTKLLGSHFSDVFSNGNGNRIMDLLETLRNIPKKTVADPPVELNGYKLRLNILPIHDEHESTTIIILNDVTGQKHMEEILDQAQKMEALGTLAGGMAHDFNNLLMGIQGNLSLILKDIEPDHIHYDRLKAMENYVKSGGVLANHLLGLGKNTRQELVPTHLNGLIIKSSSMFGRTHNEIVICRRLEENLWITATDPVQIEQVLLNLYVNACQAMASGGSLYLKTENITLSKQFVKPYGAESGRYVKVSIADTGTGMDKETLKKIFDPFFTTKERGKGTGLGLTSTYRIIKNHGGFIAVSSKQGKGTTFDIFLPASGNNPRENKGPSEKSAISKETILFVDDEEWVLDAGGQMLKHMGYRCLTARNGREALEVYKEHWEEIDIVVIDMIMPEMGGGETLERLRAINPAIKALLSSGYDMGGEVSEILACGCKGFIQKPFTMKQLSEKLRTILDME